LTGTEAGAGVGGTITKTEVTEAMEIARTIGTAETEAETIRIAETGAGTGTEAGVTLAIGTFRIVGIADRSRGRNRDNPRNGGSFFLCPAQQKI
jgi:hypothetical protein